MAVVNCADSHNIKLCRDYDVTGYPTIKVMIVGYIHMLNRTRTFVKLIFLR